ncbi:B-cell receptor CD22 [Anabarilius grahami]|uniref:B-cell receptor CD22 n=1 Tax=Anabarilius grahami TaxID=495550 RepID=A0A3N0Z256_ANAGA|nr:B-cell receptor CD22 [Anabarilius grahami]
MSVSISPSGEKVSGDSVTLNCSSDSNPPALNFSWFKENETSAVGSGQSFSISSFNSSFSGRFYCEAQNKYGSQRSASVSLTVKGVQRAALHTVSGIMAGCGGLIFIIIIIIVFIKSLCGVWVFVSLVARVCVFPWIGLLVAVSWFSCFSLDYSLDFTHGLLHGLTDSALRSPFTTDLHRPSKSLCYRSPADCYVF